MTLVIFCIHVHDTGTQLLENRQIAYISSGDIQVKKTTKWPPFSHLIFDAIEKLLYT
jgi:hypothetical protein